MAVGNELRLQEECIYAYIGIGIYMNIFIHIYCLYYIYIILLFYKPTQVGESTKHNVGKPLYAKIVAWT